MWRCGECQTLNQPHASVCQGCARPRAVAVPGDDTRLRPDATPAPPIVVGPSASPSQAPSPLVVAGLALGSLVLVALVVLVVLLVRGRGGDTTTTAATPSTTTTVAESTSTTATTVATTATTVRITIPPSTTPPPTPAPTVAPAPTPTRPRPTSAPSNVRYYTNVDPVNLRTSPSLSAHVILRIPTGTSLPAICKAIGDTLPASGGGPNSDTFDNNIWIRTSYDGNEGWVVDAVMRTRGAATDGTIPSC